MGTEGGVKDRSLPELVLRRTMDSPVTVSICLAAAAATLLMPRSPQWLLSKDALLEGRIWTIFTSIFFHNGSGHLSWDLMGTMIAGVIAEPFVSRKFFILFLLVACIITALTSVVMYSDFLILGISAVQQAIVGGIIAILWWHQERTGAILTAIFFLSKIGGEILGFSYFSAYLSILGGRESGPNIAAWSHLAGLCTGFVMFHLYYARQVAEKRHKETAASS